MKLAIAAALTALALAVPTSARAEVDIPRADALFNEALSLKATNLEAACKKFEESLQYNPQALGTLLNVALCDEKLGRIASAVARFSEALDRAKEQGLPDYIAAAEEHLKPLLPDVPHLTIRFAEPPLPDTTLVIDDRVIAHDGRIDVASVPVDPGNRQIKVSAPGRVTYEATVAIYKGEQRKVDIPVLKPAVVRASRRSIGRITVAAGAGAVIAGVIVGLVAQQRYDEQFEKPAGEGCDAMLMCTRPAQTEIESALLLGNVGTVVGIVGVGAVAVGAYLWLTGPSTPSSSKERAVTVVPTLAPDGAGLSARGRF